MKNLKGRINKNENKKIMIFIQYEKHEKPVLITII